MTAGSSRASVVADLILFLSCFAVHDKGVSCDCMQVSRMKATVHAWLEVAAGISALKA